MRKSKNLLRIFSILWIVLCAPGALAAGKGSIELTSNDPASDTWVQGHRHALLIGVDRFRDALANKRLKALPEVRNDLAALGDALVAAGFEVRRIHSGTPEKPNRDMINIEVRQLNRRAHNGDTVLVYFSGHGKGEWLYTYNYDSRGAPGDTCLNVASLAEKLKESPAKRRILIIDACHSGVAVHGSTKAKAGEEAALDLASLDRLSGEGFYVLASCQPGERSWIDKAEGRSYFTKYLVAGLRGAADGRGNGVEDCRIDLIDLYQYVHEEADNEVNAEVRDAAGQPASQRALMKIEGEPRVYLAAVPGCEVQRPVTRAEWQAFRKLRERLETELAAARAERGRLAEQGRSLDKALQALQGQEKMVRELVAEYRERNRALDDKEKKTVVRLEEQRRQLEAQAHELAAQRSDLHRRTEIAAGREARIASREKEMKRKLAEAGNLQPSPEPPSSDSKAEIIDRDERFVAYQNGTVLDTQTGLMWAAADNGKNIDWENAKAYCEKYREGGYKDWRMPTLNELESLYESGPGYSPECDNGKVKLTDKIRFTCYWMWSSETRGSEAAGFGFDGGGRFWVPRSSVPFSPVYCRCAAANEHWVI